MDSLTGELLQEILLRVQFASLFKARQVCRTWRQIVGCQGFRDKYISRAKLQLVETEVLNSGWVDIDVTDGNNNIVLTFPRILFCKASCPNSPGFRIGILRSGTLYAGDIFKNKWLKIPRPPGGELGNIAVVGSGNGRNVKLVNWDEYGCIRVLQLKKREWLCRREPDSVNKDLIAPSAPAVLGSCMFRMDARRRMLLRYNIAEDEYSEVAIITCEARFNDVWSRQFVVSEDKLYFLQQAYSNTLSLWNISTGDGVATLIMELHDVEVSKDGHPRIDPAIEDNRLTLHVRDPIMINTRTYNITTKCLESENDVSCTRRTVPLTYV